MRKIIESNLYEKYLTKLDKLTNEEQEKVYGIVRDLNDYPPIRDIKARLDGLSDKMRDGTASKEEQAEVSELVLYIAYYLSRIFKYWHRDANVLELMLLAKLKAEHDLAIFPAQDTTLWSFVTGSIGARMKELVNNDEFSCK